MSSAGERAMERKRCQQPREIRMFTRPVSSSRLAKVVPRAVMGGWRWVTTPATRTRCPSGRSARAAASGDVELPEPLRLLTLDTNVGISDTGVVKSDIPATGAIAPPKRKGARSAPSVPLADIRSRSAAELERDLTELLRGARPTCVTTEVAADGSPKVASLVSVWLLSQVGNAVGKPKFVNLSKVRREELRSIGGVARLAHRTLHPVPAVKAS